MDLSFESVPSLQPFAEIARRLGVRLTLRGSVVRRLVRTAIRDVSELAAEDLLCSLTPFTSDVDVEHSGPPALNARVHQELIGSVPMAGCVRMEVRSEQESKGFREAERFQATIPVLRMRLSSEGFRDLHGGVSDVLRGEYRFLHSPEYQRSPLYRAGRDLGFFAVLLYVKALLEDGAKPSADAESQVRDSVQYAQAPEQHDAQAPEQHDYLRARALYLWARHCRCVSGARAIAGTARPIRTR